MFLFKYKKMKTKKIVDEVFENVILDENLEADLRDIMKGMEKYIEEIMKKATKKWTDELVC